MKLVILLLSLSFSCFAKEPTLDEYAREGLGEHRDAEQSAFSQSLLNKAKKEGGTVKIYTWYYKGKKQVYVLMWNPKANGFVGPNAQMGFHDAVFLKVEYKSFVTIR